MPPFLSISFRKTDATSGNRVEAMTEQAAWSCNI